MHLICGGVGNEAATQHNDATGTLYKSEDPQGRDLARRSYEKPLQLLLFLLSPLFLVASAIGSHSIPFKSERTILDQNLRLLEASDVSSNLDKASSELMVFLWSPGVAPMASYLHPVSLLLI